MQFHCQTVAALVVLDEAYQRPHSGVMNRCAELFGRIDQCAVITGRICARKQHLGVRTAFLNALFKGISQADIQQPPPEFEWFQNVRLWISLLP